MIPEFSLSTWCESQYASLTPLLATIRYSDDDSGGKAAFHNGKASRAQWKG
jgi:hypothetical protein